MRDNDTLRTEHPPQSVDVTNRSTDPMTLYVEPWGDEFVLQPMECLRVVIVGPHRTAIPVSYLGGAIIVEGWENTTAEVWKGEVRLN